MEIKSGIYKITNLVNGKIYVGSAMDLVRRKNVHFRQLNTNTHNNKKFQASWDKHGAWNFQFTIIEYVEDIKDLISREQFYLDTLLKASEENDYFNNYALNLTRKAGNTFGFKFSDESKQKISEKRSIKPEDYNLLLEKQRNSRKKFL